MIARASDRRRMQTLTSSAPRSTKRRRFSEISSVELLAESTSTHTSGASEHSTSYLIFSNVAGDAQATSATLVPRAVRTVPRGRTSLPETSIGGSFASPCRPWRP